MLEASRAAVGREPLAARRDDRDDVVLRRRARHATILYPVALIAATLIGIILGSSFTTVAGLGVPFVALAPLMGLSPEVAAAAVVAGAFTGDGVARVSDTVVLTTDMVGGVTPARQSSIMARLVAPGWVATLALMIHLGIRDGGGSFDGGAVTEVIETEFSVSLLCLLPLLIVFIISTKSSAFFAVLGGALSALVIAGFAQRDLIERLAGDDRAYMPVRDRGSRRSHDRAGRHRTLTARQRHRPVRLRWPARGRRGPVR
jgi:hypothetical protein